MTTEVDRIVQQAYKLIDDQHDYKIPKLERWKRQNNFGIKKVSACKSCGKIILHLTDKNPDRCQKCREKISYLYKKRNNKGIV